MRHLKQHNFRKDPTRHRFALAGRRGGKTVGVREIILEEVSKFGPRTEAFFVAPSHMQAMELMWEPLEERLFNMKASYKALVSKQRIEFPGRRAIFLIGAEKISRVRGHAIGLACLDEVAFFSKPLPDVWRAIRPALTDRNGRAVITTTPNGKGTPAYDFYLNILKQPKDWSYHHWSTYENPGISQTEVENAKRELDERSFRQEYEATWESFEGLAYYTFRESVHVTKQPDLDPSLPIELSFDFNVNPTTLIVSQLYGGMISVKRLYRFSNSSTEATVKAFCEDHKHLSSSAKIEIYGDSAGNNRHSSTGRADYEHIKEILMMYGFQYQMKVFGRNPAIIDRVAWVNSWLMSISGHHRIEIDPQADGLIRDLSSQPLDGRFPSDKNNLGHAADALGYRVAWAQMLATRGASGTIQL